MPSAISRSHESIQRRSTFRDYMRKLNPTAPARMTIDSGLVIEDIHASLFRTLAARADLDPGSQQLLVGGIGSGKTTELLMAERWLQEQGQTLPVYIDVSGETDLSVLNSGALLAIFGLHLAREFSKRFGGSFLEGEEKSLRTAQSRLHEFAFGKTEQVWVSAHFEDVQDYDEEDFDVEPGHFVINRVPGKLKPRFPVLQRDVQDIAGTLKMFISAFQSRSLDVVVIFDGLDRLIFPDKFWAVVDQDFRALRRMGVAVIAAAPLSILYGEGRPVSEHFDRIHQIHALGPEPISRSLKAVLARRGGTDLLRDQEAEFICAFCGGVLRDLIALARDAGETAYIEGARWIYAEHASSAVAQLGESYRRGLSPVQLDILRRLAKNQEFDPASNDGVELLVTGRVIEYSATDFRVHPALGVLIAEA